MATLVELAAEIVSSHASTSAMTTDQLLQEIQKVYAELKKLEAADGIIIEVEEPHKPMLTIKQAFKKDEVICMVCGKGGMKTLTRHLKTAHDLKPGKYKKQFGIPGKQPLTAKSFTAARKQMAEERGLGAILAKARETRASNIKAKKTVAVKKATPVKNIAPVKPAKAKAVKKDK